MEEFIDLGREYDSSPCCCSEKPKGKGKKSVSYPTLYISGVKGLNLTTGEIEFTAKGKVVSVSNRTSEKEGDQWSAEIEVHSISAPGAEAEEGSSESSSEKLRKAIDDAAKSRKKPTKDEEEDDEED
jgi:hypothetical protein